MGSQRDTMRELFRKYRGDERRVVEEYAAAERRGEVDRASNEYGLTPEEYAYRLLEDARKKGWIRADAYCMSYCREPSRVR